MFRTSALFALLALSEMVLAGSPLWSMSSDMPDDWVTTPVGNAFCISMPPGIRRQPTRAKDSLAGQFGDATVQVFYDYGIYASPLSEFDKLKPSVEAVRVDGRMSKLIALADMTAVHVPNVAGSNGLTVIVRYEDASVGALARQIIQTIRFEGED